MWSRGPLRPFLCRFQYFSCGSPVRRPGFARFCGQPERVGYGRLAVSQSFGARGAHFRRGALIFCILVNICGLHNPCRAALEPASVESMRRTFAAASPYRIGACALKPWNVQLLREFPHICALCIWRVYIRGLIRFFYAGQSFFLNAKSAHGFLFRCMEIRRGHCSSEIRANFKNALRHIRSGILPRRFRSRILPKLPDFPHVKQGKRLQAMHAAGAKTAPVNASYDIGVFPKRFDSLLQTLPAAKAAARGRKKAPGNVRAPLAFF